MLVGQQWEVGERGLKGVGESKRSHVVLLQNTSSPFLLSSLVSTSLLPLLNLL